VNTKEERCGKKSLPNRGKPYRNFPAGTKDNCKNLCQDSCCTTPPAHKSTAQAQPYSIQLTDYIYRFDEGISGMFGLIRLHSDNSVPDSWINPKEMRKRNNHRNTCNRPICPCLKAVLLMDTRSFDAALQRCLVAFIL
jgi:hypothetical protein